MTLVQSSKEIDGCNYGEIYQSKDDVTEVSESWDMSPDTEHGFHNLSSISNLSFISATSLASQHLGSFAGPRLQLCHWRQVKKLFLSEPT